MPTESTKVTIDKAELDELRAKAARNSISGYLVKTPFNGFSGESAGVRFRNGTAFIPDGPRAAPLVTIMLDLDYKVSHVDDWEGMDPASQDTLARNFIDYLTK